MENFWTQNYFSSSDLDPTCQAPLVLHLLLIHIIFMKLSVGLQDHAQHGPLTPPGLHHMVGVTMCCQ